MLAKEFADEFSMGEWGKYLGLLHDLGKERISFQKYIRKTSGVEDSNYHGEDKRHAYVGAIVSYKYLMTGNLILPFVIMGHHGGLADYTDLKRGLLSPIPNDVKIPSLPDNLSLDVKMTASLRGLQTKSGQNKGINHLIRMLFSCLVDADYLDTERFMTPDNFSLRGTHKPLSELKPLLDSYLASLRLIDNGNPINQLRQKIQDECISNARKSSANGCYSLSVPTGAGKTLSSLAWAMEHCIRHNKKRIIIAIPYTSIVTQTAHILSNIFGKENVLEHHSSQNPSDIQDSNLRLKMKMATENWDYPIVVTTNVQLIESMLSSKPSKCRKLHNVANCAVILDEVQTLPINHLQPIVDTLVAYQTLFNTAILFSTASLPAINGKIKWKGNANNTLEGIPNLTEIIPESWELHKHFKRCQLVFDDEIIGHADLAAILERHNKVLCIVNTRKDAKEIYSNLSNDGHIIHLSRMMCSAHLKDKLNELKNLLASDTAGPVRVISTQLIEAGVDIDFPIVYRQEAGLDSIIQAAGRCNREGKLPSGEVHVFKLPRKPFGSIGRATDSCNNMVNVSDWFAPKTMYDYFIQRYSREASFDEAKIASLLYNPSEMCYETAADKFKMISDNSICVYVNYGESPKLIDKLLSVGPSSTLMRELSLYSVGIYEKDFKELFGKGFIREVMEGIFWIDDPNQYDQNLGLVIDSHWIEETLIL